MDDPAARLVALVRLFLSGADRSLSWVNRVEGVLLEHYADTDLYEAIGPAIAQYRPGGGEHLYDEEQLAGELRYVLRRFFPAARPGAQA